MKNWGIKRRVLFLALLPALLVSTLLAGYLIFKQSVDLEDTLKERGFALVRHLGPASEYGVFSASSDILQPLISSALNEPDVRSITITDEQGETILTAGEPGDFHALFTRQVLRPVSAESEKTNSLVFRAPILRSEFVIDQQLDDELQLLEQVNGADKDSMRQRLLGWVTVSLDRSRTVTRRNEMIISSILLTLLVLGVGMVLAVRLGQDVSDPIVVLTEAVKRIQSGQLDEKITVTAGGELGKLASGMNAMMAALQAAQSELQQRVDQATSQYKDALSLLERKNVELDNARRQAEAASEAKSEFLANVSHEVRNPLNGVLGFLGLLEKTELSPQQRGFLHTIDVSARNLLTIINDLLDLSRIEAGKMSLDFRVFSIEEMLKDILALHSPAAEEKKLKLILNVDDELPEYAEGDSVRIGQVLSNLIGNAVKFTEQGEIRISCRVRENLKRRLVPEFAVSDTGPGIEPDHQASIYESFYQVEGGTKRSHEGAGLGLAIAKKLVEMMGGTIEMESAPGQGTRIWFTVVLSVTHRSESQARQQDEPGKPSGVAGRMVEFTGPLKVLVVDDNEINRRLGCVMMSAYGIDVDEADSAVHAIDRIRQNNYDLVLMDVHMPRMDGLEATTAIRELDGKPAAIPIIALTADIVAERRKNYLAAGMNDYLAKPIEEHALLTILLKWCPEKVKPGPLLSGGRMYNQVVDQQVQLPVLDSELGLRYASGKQSVWEKSLSLLTKALRTQLIQLTEAVDGQNMTTVAEIAHSIKGSARYCGASILGNAAQELETAARNTDFDQIQSTLTALREAASQFNDYLVRRYPDVVSIPHSGEITDE